MARNQVVKVCCGGWKDELEKVLANESHQKWYSKTQTTSRKY